MPIAKYIYLNPKRQKANTVDINENTRQTFGSFASLSWFGNLYATLKAMP